MRASIDSAPRARRCLSRRSNGSSPAAVLAAGAPARAGGRAGVADFVLLAAAGGRSAGYGGGRSGGPGGGAMAPRLVTLYLMRSGLACVRFTVLGALPP